MAYSIALSGKGGVGKTTIAALIVRHLIETTKKSVLAVDADPNSSLGDALGVKPKAAVADIREDILERKQEYNLTGASKEREIEFRIQQSIVEAKGFDLLTMGRPEGPHCYCYVNGLLRRYLKELRSNYPVVVVDCEAGMEYLSRLTVDDVDVLVLVAEATSVGLTSAARIAELASALPVKVKRRVLVLNKLNPSGPAGAPPPGARLPEADAVVHMPFDEDVYRRCVQGEPLDDTAGEACRPAVEELAGLCISLPQLAAKDSK